VNRPPMTFSPIKTACIFLFCWLSIEKIQN
jgi:hypothetical protein